MAVKKVETGWQADFRPDGRGGARVRKTFKTKREAENFIIKEKNKALDGEYIAPVKDKRRLEDLADDWHKYHGHTLATGHKVLPVLKATIAAIGNPLASKADPTDFLEYRKHRLEAGISENNMNHELAYLKSMFNELIRIKKWTKANPYADVKKLKFQSASVTYLEFDEICRLLAAMDSSRNPHVKTITEICLSTGCRWGEAQGLTRANVHAGKVHFIKTKNGLNRSVPISEDLEKRLINGAAHGPLFGSSMDAFKKAAERAKIKLPKGQKTHVLRHSFASHFMMNGGNLLDLNKILGHKTIDMTMVYAHLSPSHLAEAVKRNPLALMNESEEEKPDYELILSFCGHNVDTLANDCKYCNFYLDVSS